MQINIDPVSTTNTLTLAYAVGVVLILSFIITLLIVWAKWGGLDRDEKRQLGEIREQLQRFSAPRLTIRNDTRDLDHWRREIERLPSGEATGLRTASDAFAEVRRAWDARTPNVPRLASWLGSEAVALALLAGSVLVSTSTVREWLDTGTSSPGYYLSRAIDIVSEVVGTLVGAFPSTDVVWPLFITFVVTLYHTLYDHPVAVASILALSAGSIVLLDRVSGGRGSGQLYPDRRYAIQRAIAGVVLIYVAGAVPATGLSAADVGVASVVGGLCALLATLAVAGLTIKGLRTRFTTAVRPSPNAASVAAAATKADKRALTLARQLRDAGVPVSTRPPQGFSVRNRLPVALYLTARRLAGFAGLLVAPVMLIYLGQALLEGHLIAKVAAIADAPLRMQLALAVMALATISMLLQPDVEDWVDVGDAMLRAFNDRAVRTLLATSVLPIAAAVGISGFLLILGIPLLLAAAIGIVVGVAIRLGYYAWRWVSTRTVQAIHEDWAPPYVTVEHGSFVAPDGTEIWVVSLNSHRLAWPNRDALLDQAMHDLELILDGKQPGPSLMQTYYKQLKISGETEAQAIIQQRRTIAKRFIERLVSQSRRDRSRRERIGAVDDRLERVFDPRIVDRARDDLQQQGRLSVGDTYYRWHGD